MTQPMPAGQPMQDERSSRDPTGDPNRCGHYGGRRKDGQLCVGLVIKGTKRCRMHSGKRSAVAKAKGEVALFVEQARATLAYDGPIVDSGEIMLKGSSFAFHRATTLTGELDRMWGEQGEGGSLRDVLTGNTYAINEAGDKVKTGEYIRAMAQLEALWWKNAFDWSRQVTAAKIAIADRQGQITSRQADVFAALVQAVLLDPRIGLTPAQRAVLGEVWRDHSARLGIAGT